MHFGPILRDTVFVYVHALFVIATYMVAKTIAGRSCRASNAPARASKKIRGYLTCVFTIFVFAFVAAAAGKEDEDVPADARGISATQQIERWARVFCTLLPAAVLGVFSAYDEDKHLTPEARKVRNGSIDPPSSDEGRM